MNARNTKLTDAEIAEIKEVYEKTNNQAIVARLTHHSSFTVNKYIKLLGLSTGTGHNQTQSKISDEELLADSLTLNCVEIARKHNMTAERVYRRAQKLGININSQGAGGHYRLRTRNKAVEFDETITLKAVRERFQDICQICGERIDDTDLKNGHIQKLYPTVDHIIPLSKGGSHTWGNVQLSHMMCNAGKCDKLTYKRGGLV